MLRTLVLDWFTISREPHFFYIVNKIYRYSIYVFNSYLIKNNVLCLGGFTKQLIKNAHQANLRTQGDANLQLREASGGNII